MDTVWYNIVWYNNAWYNTVRYDPVHCSTLQFNKVFIIWNVSWVLTVFITNETELSPKLIFTHIQFERCGYFCSSKTEAGSCSFLWPKVCCVFSSLVFFSVSSPASLSLHVSVWLFLSFPGACALTLPPLSHLTPPDGKWLFLLPAEFLFPLFVFSVFCQHVRRTLVES